jgi:hypothetical protein
MLRIGGGLVLALGLAGCVASQSGTASMSHRCVTTMTGPDGQPQQALVEADDAGAAALLCEGDLASEADIAKAMLGDGPISKADKVVIKTAPSVVQVPAGQVPVQSPAPVAAQAAPVPSRPVGGLGCGLKMVGGTGYVCASN